MKIIFIRHGESEANTSKIISNTGYMYGLTEQGVIQAKSLAKQLREKYPNPTRIISSPLQRADETARIISEQFDVEYIIDERLVEFHTGILEGKSDESSWNQLYVLWNKWIKEDQTSSESLPGGESRDDIVERLEKFLMDILQTQDDNEIIFCISHGGVLITGLPNVPCVKNAEKLKKYNLKNTDIVEIVSTKKDGFICNRFGPV